MTAQATALCPVCLADRGFRPSEPRSPWERWVLRLVGRRPGRCNACGARLIRPARSMQAVPASERRPAGDKEFVDLARHQKVAADGEYDRLILDLRRAEQEKERNEADTGG